MDGHVTEARDTSFERIARTYDEARPGYPEELYDCIVSFGSLTLADRVLEVGVGTGKATVPLARRGFAILGIEPGNDLSNIARANLAAFPRVSIETARFEDWKNEHGAFGLALSAQAFHWLGSEVRLPRFADALRIGGTLALFGNAPSVADGALRVALDAVYERFASALGRRADAHGWYASAASPAFEELRASARFVDATFAAFDWQRPLSAAAYRSLLATYSDHSTLPTTEREALLDGVSSAIHEHGGTILLDYRTGLFLARRAGRQ